MNWKLISTFLKTIKHTPHTQHCIYYYTENCKESLVICLQRQLALHFTVCNLRSTSTGAKKTVIRWHILASQTFNLERLGEHGRLRSVSHHNWISKMGFTCPCCTHHDTVSTRHCPYFPENNDTWLQEWFHSDLLFYYTDHLLMAIYSSCKQ
jgi:hypothetical protein